MKARPWIWGLVVVVGFLSGVQFARKHGWSGGNEVRQTLKVGYLPVTCHLTCPVTDFATRTSEKIRFEAERFLDFPTAAEAFKAGKIEASFFIAPLAMKLRDQGVPAKIVYLGHRDGSTLMVAKDSRATSLRDLRGKRFAIPSKYSNQFLVVQKLMQDQGLNHSLRAV